MTSIANTMVCRRCAARAWLVAVLLVWGAAASAKTPDGMPPSEETVCSGLSGAAFGLCNAYCEAQDCDVHPRPSCPVLRTNFEKITGSSVFPCDRRCGDGTVQRGEDCDPPGSECTDGRICDDDCTCPEPACGDWMLDPGEQCDPPGSECPDNRLCDDDCTCPEPACGDGIMDPGEECDPPGSPCNPSGTVQCSDDCTCVGQPLGCCECGATAPLCFDNTTETNCLGSGAACMFFDAPGTACNDLGSCARTNCCVCDQMCTTIVSPDVCPAGCTTVPAPSACDSTGNCQSFPVPGG